MGELAGLFFLWLAVYCVEPEWGRGILKAIGGLLFLAAIPVVMVLVGMILYVTFHN